jgi:3-methyladenine DNA glycosylase/8-oxoguanine DNA glycosylase
MHPSLHLTSSRLTLNTPANFSFARTAFSHGWYALPPFSCNKQTMQLHRVLQLSGGTLVACTLTSRDRAIDVRMFSKKKFTPKQRAEVRMQLRTCLRLDENFGEFHAEAKWHPEFKWIASSGSGRMLRAPTAFEDVVKMICTTNCTWALTTLMVTNLVEQFGKKLDGIGAAFPTPEAIAGSSERVLRKEIKAGYRSPFLLELAERVASKRHNLEAWRASPLSTNELFEKMRGVKGIGPYAAGNIMKLVGRYDYLGLDSWVRSKYYELHHNGRKVKDSTIERHYAPYGKWRGLFFWLEMTRYWHDEKFML